MAKLLKRGEDPEFDQLLSALSSCAEHCLPSLLVAMCKWHTCQYSSETGGRRHTLHATEMPSAAKEGGSSGGTLPRSAEKDPLLEKRDVRGAWGGGSDESCCAIFVSFLAAGHRFHLLPSACRSPQTAVLSYRA